MATLLTAAPRLPPDVERECTVCKEPGDKAWQCVCGETWCGLHVPKEIMESNPDVPEVPLDPKGEAES